MSDSRRKSHHTIKVLCLHGYGTNDKFMELQTRQLKKDLGSHVELFYANSPYPIPPELVRDPRVISRLEGPPRSWFHDSYFHKTAQQSQMMRTMKEVCDNYSLACSSPDAVIGFSQGTSMFMAIKIFHQLGSFDHPVLKSIKFFIAFNPDPSFVNLIKLNWQRLKIPSMHVLSQQDFIFQKGVWTPSFFENSQVIIHNYGHRFPILDSLQKKAMIQFIVKNSSKSKQTARLHKSRL